MTPLKSARLVLSAAAAAVLVCGPAQGQAPVQTQAPAQTTRIKLTLDSRIEGPVAPFLVAIDKGYFKAQGLDVAVEPTAGPPEAIQRVADGIADIGFADINALIRYRDSHPSPAIKAVFMVYNRPAYAIIGRRSRGVGIPKDLEGRVLGAPVAESASALWPLFAKANGIDTRKVQLENIGIPVRDPMLQNGQVDAVTGLSFQSFVNLKAMGVPPDDLVVMPMANHGVDLYGNALIVSDAAMTERPEMVTAALRAVLRGLKDTLKNPAGAVESVLRRNDGVRRSVELERLRMVINDNILTPEVKAGGFGAVDPARFATAVDQLAQLRAFKNGKPPLDAIFDARFLPPAAERKAD